MSTAATKAELFTQAGNASWVLENLSDYLASNTENLIGNLDDFEQDLEGDRNQEKLAGMAAVRNPLGNVLAPSTVRGVFSPILADLMKAIGRDSPQATDQSRFDTLHDYMVENSETIQEDEYSLDATPNADGSNTGNGALLRLSVDENGEVIQGIHLETKRVECVLDQNSPGGIEHEEVFTFSGAARSVDWAEVTGSNQSPLARGRVPNTITALSARTSTTWITNPSFGTFTGSTGAGNLTALDGWAVAGGDITATLEIDTADYYRDFLGEQVPASLVFTDDETVSQIVKDVAGGSYDDTTPYWLQVAVKPTTGTSGGNIILRLGAITRTVALTSLNANAWNVVGILSAPGANCWPAKFREADLTISVEIENLAGGTGVKIDDLTHGPMTQVDGHWYVVVPAAASNTAWKRGDFFTWADSLSARGIIQYWFGFRTGWGYLPSATSTPTYDDPS